MIDELDLLREAGRRHDVDGAHAEKYARRALERAIDRERRPRRGASARVAPRRWLRPARVAVLLALTALALTLAATLRSGSTTGPPPAAGAVLERLAVVAAAQPAAVPGPGEYLYSASHSHSDDTVAAADRVYCQFDFTEYRQNWIAADGEGLFVERDGAQHLAPGMPAACRSVLPRSELLPTLSRNWAARGCLSISPVPLGRLPRDPAVLRARLLTGKVEGGPPGAAEAFTQVGDLLRETDAPPALRAALYRAAAGLAGVRSLGTVTDPLARRGVGLAIEGDGIRHELIFDPRTGALLAEEGVVTAHTRGERAPLGSLAYWSAYAPERVVDRLPSPSPLPLRPACVRGGATVRQVPGQPSDSVLVGSSFLKLGAAPGPR